VGNCFLNQSTHEFSESHQLLLNIDKTSNYWMFTYSQGDPTLHYVSAIAYLGALRIKGVKGWMTRQLFFWLIRISVSQIKSSC